MQPACGRIGRVALVTLLGLSFESCMSWKAQPVSPQQVVEQRPEQVRLSLVGGTKVVVAGPAIVGDSLVGAPAGANPKQIAQRIAIPLSDIQSVEVQRVNGGKTALLIGGVGVTALVVIAAANCCGPDFKSPPPTDGGGGGGGPVVSCPLVYSWDGTQWRLDSGTFGGAIAPAFARVDLDNLVYATAENDRLRLRVANELNETDYLDALSVLAVDHAPGTTIAPDGGGGLHAIGSLAEPLSVRDHKGRDVLSRVRTSDGWGWESTPTLRDTSLLSNIRDGIELAFLRPSTGVARLVVDGNNTPWAAHLMQEFVAAHGRETRAWYDSLSARPELARQMGRMLAQEAFLGVSVWTGNSWAPQGYIWEAGPEIVKRQAFSLDLSRVRGDTIRIRLESAPSFWHIDRVALAKAEPGPASVTELWPEIAVDRDGANVLDLIGAQDRRHYVMERGASAELSFRVPAVPAGKVRSYLVRSAGWYRIHAPETEPADIASLHTILNEEHGASRLSVARFNAALLAMRVAQ